MTPFFVHDAAGRILRAGIVPSEAAALIQAGRGETARLGEADPAAQRWDGDRLVPLPPPEPEPEQPKPPPASLPRLAFWTYLAGLGVTRATVLSEIDRAERSGTLDAVAAERMRLKVTDAERYPRTDPLVLQMALALGVATSQADIDEHYARAEELRRALEV